MFSTPENAKATLKSHKYAIIVQDGEKKKQYAFANVNQAVSYADAAEIANAINGLQVLDMIGLRETTVNDVVENIA